MEAARGGPTGELVEEVRREPLGLRVRADPRALRALRRRLADHLSSSSVPLDRVDEVLLAATEAASNAIEHARDPSVGWVDVEVALQPAVTVTVRDHGSWKEPDPETDRGRGTRIMSSLADLDTRRDDGGTTVVLTFPFAGVAPLATFATEVRGDLGVVRVEGELDLSNVDDLVAAVESLRTARVALDLGGLRYIDSSPIRHIVRMARDGVPLAIVCPERAIPNRVLRVTGIDEVVPMVESLEALGP